VAENFLTFGEKLTIQHGVADEAGALVVGGVHKFD
jgi:hypothetical protein